MRSREQIEKDIRHSRKILKEWAYVDLILEALLDIRELLIEMKSKKGG